MSGASFFLELISMEGWDLLFQLSINLVDMFVGIVLLTRPKQGNRVTLVGLIICTIFHPLVFLLLWDSFQILILLICALKGDLGMVFIGYSLMK